jgi:hypothetical protein
MHLKAYSIDGEVLRTGSANFSTGGERARARQAFKARLDMAFGNAGAFSNR